MVKGKKVAISKKRWEEMKQKVKEAKENLYLLQRIKADFDNYRKKVEKERLKLMEFANEDLLLDLLPVIDNFERALNASQRSQDFTSHLKGVELIEKQLLDVLKKRGLEPMEVIGKRFNPEEHDAVEVVDSKDQSEDTIIGEVLKGYKLNGKLIRPSKVKVAKKVSQEGGR